MLRLLVIAGAMLTACLLAPAALAETCTLAPGDYVDADSGGGVSPAMVLEATGDPCYVTVRVLMVEGQPFDAYAQGFYQSALTQLVGVPPYDKPFGCPYAPSDKADLHDQYGEWRAATILSSDRYCSYRVEYWLGTQTKQFGATDLDLRPPSVPPPTAEEIRNGEEQRTEVQNCPAGGRAVDYAGEAIEDHVKQAVATEIAEQQGNDPSVYFDKVRAGETAIASPGSILQSRNPEASVGSTIYAYRLDVTVCRPGTPERTLSRFRIDYSCYTDRFGDFACRRDATRQLE